MIAANVYLWGTKIGLVIQNDLSDIPKFSYDKDFLKSNIELSPVVMPLSSKIYSFPSLNKKTFYMLPGLLAESLPDSYGTKLIEKYLSMQNRKLESLSAVERLLYVGKRAMGALEYLPEMEFCDNKTDFVDINSLVEIASEILSQRENSSLKEKKPQMESIIKVGTSAGGARAKAIIAVNKKTNEIKSGQISPLKDYEYWIIKFDGVLNNDSYTKVEYAYYLMAKNAGITMNECKLYEENNRFHFMTKRFDRRDDGQKLHMQSLGAIAHYDYNTPGVNGYEQAADVMYKLKLNQDEIEELFRRMVFNVMARNQDDHVKNISFLMNKKGVWHLAPAYDVTYSYNPSSYWTKRHQMSVNSKLDDFNVNDFLKSAKYMNISEIRAKNIIEKVRTSLFNWLEFAQEANVDETQANEIKNNLILFN